MRELDRILIVNRGEPAMRLIAAVQELNVGRARPMTTIALFTEPDADAMFVRHVDEAIPIGPALWVDPADGIRKSRYLDYGVLRQVLLESRADAAWVGWGFVAEHAAFAELCDELGVAFVGPSAGVMRQLGDKITSKRIAEQAEVPVAPWSGGPVETLAEARLHAERIGYPLMVKATAGGGGRGIRKVDGPAELEEAFTTARSEALAGFGDATVFLEKRVDGARHIEVQLLGDGQGTTWALGVRDCTIQRRNQKLLEESPSPVLDAEQQDWICAAASRLGAAVDYRGAGTVEFLFQPQTGTFSFMEVNARLQVEHTVTELVTGLDLVKAQLHVAAGGSLEGSPPRARGHAIEVRVTAEDPERAFAPAPGVIERLRLPFGPGLRIDTGVEAGDEIAPQFDSMIAKVIAHGADRSEALARLRRALEGMTLVIGGGASNKGFLQALLERDEVRRSTTDIGWLDRQVEAGEHISRRGREVAILAAALAAFREAEERARARFFASAARERPEASAELGHQVELTSQGVPYRFDVGRLGSDTYRVTVDDLRIDLERRDLGPDRVRLRIGDQSWNTVHARQGADRIVEVDGIPHRIAGEAGGTVRAPSPGVVVSLGAGPGDEVERGQRVAVLEAMKTETELKAPFSGRVAEVYVLPNVQVGAGARLMKIEGEGRAQELGERLSFEALARPQDDDCAERRLDNLRRLVLGFDGRPEALHRALLEHGTLCPGMSAESESLWAAERAILSVFADLSVLFRRDPPKHREDRSTTEYLNLYLRDLTGRGEGLPHSFVERLQRALAHYGIESLEPTPELLDSLYRVSRARAQQAGVTGALRSVLQRWLDVGDAVAERADGELHRLLDRLVASTEGRFPVLNDLAREVRFHALERPLLEDRQRAILAEATAVLDRVHQGDTSARGEGIAWLVAVPRPLRSFFRRAALEWDGTSPERRGVLLEVMCRRTYRNRALTDVHTLHHDGFTFLSTTYRRQGHDHRLLAAHGRPEQVPSMLQAVTALTAALPPDVRAMFDLYVDQESAERVTSDHLRGLVESVDFGRQMHRVVFSVAGPRVRTGRGAEQYITFRQREDGGFVEDRLCRGLHPMMAKRLHLWRLDHFDLERLPAAEGIYLFRAVGRENPKDIRLYAVAEVWDLMDVRDAVGRLATLPQVERQLLEALDAIRSFQATLSEHQRLHWNRVRLIVRPVVRLPAPEWGEVVQKLGPATRGLGLEKVLLSVRVPGPGGRIEHKRLEISNPGGRGVSLRVTDPPTSELQPLSRYTQAVVRLRRRGLVYPYELLDRFTPSEGTASELPPGVFVEHDLDAEGALVPVEREPGQNTANVVVGTVAHFTTRYPEGMKRVIVLGDPSRSMGSLAEPECRRIIAALDLAERLGVPLEWFAVSAGARIALDSGTENMDWIALVLRHIVHFTQGGGEVNVVVAGVNVGAQPYWNAEATMLMHTRGVLIQTAQGAMVLTGKRALDYSGGVSAEDNFGIGGYDRIMGPNGQAQYFADDVDEACQILLRHYTHTYVAPGERFPRRARTEDPIERDVCDFPGGGEGFSCLGEVFSEETNPGRKRPFDIRTVMRATVDRDHPPLERWPVQREAEVAVVWDAHIGGFPVCLVGLESKPLPRLGYVPQDGPERWTAGTLFPQASKKVARAINSASGSRPVVLLANLSGFDGSPDSLRNWQLEYGAEIGRAVVNFDGPILFCVVSRYHGGAFVVFSARLNDRMEVVALEGTHASVIGGAPAAAVVFARDVQQRADRDPRVQELRQRVNASGGALRSRLQARLAELRREVHSEKLGEVATEFDAIHSVQRAQEVGSVHRIIPPSTLRPYLVEALERATTGAEG